jgi:hypothetical protein
MSNRKLRKSRNRSIKSFVRHMKNPTIRTEKFAAAMANFAYILKNHQKKPPKLATGGLAHGINLAPNLREFDMQINRLPPIDINKSLYNSWIKDDTIVNANPKILYGPLDGHFEGNE